MNDIFNTSKATNEIQNFMSQSNSLRSLIILLLAITIAYLSSKYLARAIIKLAQVVSTRTDKESNEEKHIRLRQIETYLSVAVAGVRAVVVGIVAYQTWYILNPNASSSGVAAIGASAAFIVFAGQSLGMILRDVTAGSTMIIEHWFNVGDYVKIEPFMDVTGVVERFTLRSTKLRSLNGEIIWIHNQQIQSVHVTPMGIRTMAVDVFVRDRELGETTLKEIIEAVPSGPTLLAKPLRIKSTERWGDDLWRITVIGYTAPGREWLIEKFFVNAIKDIDDGVRAKSKRIFVYEPITRFADPIADKKFLRAIRANKHD
ncbi:mechanosensitive ion channel family protein [Candidatus Saccharibacteria bacterium]|nr:mechanosensitive ion channel family protein [Candidatus Saccharibacteria bacterium]